VHIKTSQTRRSKRVRPCSGILTPRKKSGQVRYIRTREPPEIEQIKEDPISQNITWKAVQIQHEKYAKPTSRSYYA
jgi:hypothetical protein